MVVSIVETFIKSLPSYSYFFFLDWYGHFNPIPWGNQSTNFREHLINFFDFYGRHFDFKNNVICPFLGVPLKKKAFIYGKEELPFEMGKYLLYMQRINIKEADHVKDLFAYEKPMVVQDPFELVHNVAKGVRAPSVERFVGYCKLTADYLKTKKSL